MDFGVKWNLLRSLDSSAARSKSSRRRRRPTKSSPASPTAFSLQRPRRSRGRSLRRGDRSRAVGKVPIFGVCMGHQILALALGAQNLQAQVRPSRRQPARHRQGHGPGRDQLAQPRLRGRRTSSPACDVEVTHINLNDKTVEGMRVPERARRFRSSTIRKLARAP